MILAYFTGCAPSFKIELDPESQDFYETARLIMTREEEEIFRYLPDKESREEFIQEFWLKRDPDPDSDENQFKEEFFRRIEYANRHFQEGPPGWKTDRGRIYIYLGPPDKVDETIFHHDPSIRGTVIIWVYYDHELAIRFIDETGTGRYKFDPLDDIAGNLMTAIEQAKFGAVVSRGEGRKFLDFSLDFDRSEREIIISIPVKALSFKAEDDLLLVDFEFEFYICQKQGTKKEKFRESRSFSSPEEEVLKLNEIVFTFPLELESGTYFFDVIVHGESLGKARKIIEVKI